MPSAGTVARSGRVTGVVVVVLVAMVLVSGLATLVWGWPRVFPSAMAQANVAYDRGD